MDPTNWEGMWNEGERPRFDALEAHPALVSLIQSNSLLPGSVQNASAIVPGCGPGYEIIALAESGIFSSVMGLDIAPTGVATAKRNAADKCGADVLDRINIICGDFFKLEAPPGGFNFAFDYTVCLSLCQLCNSFPKRRCTVSK